MFETIFDALSWARNQGFSLNSVPLRLRDGRELVYYPDQDDISYGRNCYPDACWNWAYGVL